MIVKNISSATTTTLIYQDEGKGGIEQITICNCNQDEAVKVRLFIDDGTTETSIVENLNIPGGVTMLLDHKLGFNDSVYSLQLQTQGTGVDVNVIIK